MCEFCKEHGEGKKWYLQAKNYSEELFNEERKRFIRDFYEKFEENVVTTFGGMDQLKADPEAAMAMLPSLIEEQKKTHWGQVVPLEEIDQILDMMVNIVRLPCACRSALRGVYDARYCFGVTTFKGAEEATILEYPDWAGDFEVLTNEEAKKAIQKLDRNGLVHSVWTFITPFIYGVCNCTATDCLAMKGRLRSGVPLAFPFFKAEYVATIDWESCNGCKDCLKNCQFGAISYSPTVQKCYIDQFQCYGCGVCRALCNRDAITLKDRNAIPVLAEEW